MNYAINIYCSPSTGPVAATALHFCENLVTAGHSIYRLFFFSDGVYNSIQRSPQDTLPLRWQALILQQGIDATVCVSSAATRGIYPLGDPRPGQQPLPGFTISGLGQLIDAAVHTDRLISFGGQ